MRAGVQGRGQFLDFADRDALRDVSTAGYTVDMAKTISVPFTQLVYNHREIGCHRGRQWGFRAVFGFPTLLNLPFVHLAGKVKRAYEGSDTPTHVGWIAQREALQWLVDRGRDGIYALDDKSIEVKATPFRAYAILDGNHRAIALYILGETKVSAILRR